MSELKNSNKLAMLKMQQDLSDLGARINDTRELLEIIKSNKTSGVSQTKIQKGISDMRISYEMLSTTKRDLKIMLRCK